jgi:hypothetical protein
MDPLTLIVTALALGAAAGLKPVAEQAVKDVYAGLKLLIQQKYSNVSVTQLEQSPESEIQKAAVKETLAKTDAAKDTELLRQAQAVLQTVRDKAPEIAGAIQVSLADVEAGANLNVADLIATGDITIGMQKVKANQDINIKGLRAGGTTAASNLGEQSRDVADTSPKV